MANEVDEFLADVAKDETQEETFVKNDKDPLEQKEEDETKGVIADKEEKLPFHKDPKVQRYIEKEISKRIKDIPVQQVERESSSDEDSLTETLVEIIGNDTPAKVAAVKKFREQLGQLEERGAERALSELRQQAEADQAEEAAATEELATAFENLEEEFDIDLTSNTAIARKERSDFIDFIKRVAPKDSNGDVISYPDLTETYRLYKDTKKSSENKRAKDVASRGLQRSSDASSSAPRGNSWKDVDKIFAKINN